MIHEFAIEPELLGSFEKLRFYASHLGFDKGRVLSQFPSEWLDRVRKACPPVSGLSAKKMEERLVRLKREALLDRGRTYDRSMDWPQNAVQSHAQQAFRAIITASNPDNLPGITIDEDVDEASEPFAVEHQVTISRTAAQVARLIAPLACTSSRLVLVDPYFSPAISRDRNDWNRVYRTAWYHLMDELTRCVPSKVDVEYHTLRRTDRGARVPVGADDRKERQDWLSACREMRTHLPHVMTFRVVRWQERLGGDMLHARYALTERGGLIAEAGFDANFKWHARRMHVVLMATALHAEAWLRFGLRRCPFDFVDEQTI